MKEYKSVSDSVDGRNFWDPKTRKRAQDDERDLVKEINKLAEEGWIVKFFNVTGFLKDREELHYYALLEREKQNSN